MMTFLKVCQPLDGEDFFKRLLLRPLKNGDPAGAELLRVRPTPSLHSTYGSSRADDLAQALMSHICIRRTKEMQDANGVPLIALPPVCCRRMHLDTLGQLNVV